MMNFRKFCFGAACIASVAAIALIGLSESVSADASASKGETIAPVTDLENLDMQAIGMAQMEAMTPGEHHQMFDYFVGTWDIELKIWMEGHGVAPTVATGTSQVKKVMDGRYLQEEMTSSLMGMPYSGMGMTGYDNFGGQYQSLWVDNFSTAMHMFEGHATHDGKSIVMFGQMGEPGLVNSRTVKTISHMVDEDTHVFSMYDMLINADGEKVMQITYRRAD